MTDLTTPTTPDSFLSRPLRSTFTLDWEKGLYLLILILALITRLYGLDDRVVSHDESLHTQFSYQYFRGEGYTHNPMMHGPMVFHSAATFYWLFGVSDGSARIPVALIGVILVMLPIFLRPWIGKVGALFASFLLLISPFMTYYSRYIREDIFIIAWAVIIFLTMWYYLRERKEHYLWWFAAANALMFATKENSYIYVAIFGGFLVLRLALTLWQTPWFGKALSNLTTPLFLIAVGLIVLGGGFVAQRQAEQPDEAALTPESGEGFAADPNAPQTAPVAAAEATNNWGWVQFGGVVLASIGLFMGVRELRPRLQEYAEFDLIILFTTFTLPSVTPMFAQMTGWTPRDYGIASCVLANQDTLSPIGLFFSRLVSVECWRLYFGSGGGHVNIMLIAMTIISIALGLWWSRRRFLIIGGIFHLIFAALYTSLFSHPKGWQSGMLDSLAYWMQQQEVERGNQPAFYYLFVLPFYEFLPLSFALLGTRLWAQKNRLNKVLGYWLTVALVALLSYSLLNWYTNLNLAADAEPNRLTGLVVAGLILFAGVVYWLTVYAGRLREEYKIKRNWGALFNAEVWGDMVPFLIWWVIMSYVLYTIAGEKMPWLSTHFIPPLVFLAGWYLNEKLGVLDGETVRTRRWWLLLGLMAAFILAILFALGPILLGDLRLSNQATDNLVGLVIVLGSALLALGVYYLYFRVEGVDDSLRPQTRTLAIFILLALLTIRFNWMANGRNADYTNEFLVYAHGNPSTKDVVLNQIETLSMQMYGDKSIKVAYDDDVAWPYTWYFRDYPNRYYYGATPNNSILDAPVILIGSRNWGKIDATLQDALDQNYQTYTLTFLWWPMEEYRNIGWSSVLGVYPNPNNEDRSDQPARGLLSADVRHALWNIFFYRDFTKYGEVFGGSFHAGQWPLRHDFRMYIRNEAVTQLWQEGSAIANTDLPDIPEVPEIELPEEDVYQDVRLPIEPDGIFTNSSEGGLVLPRNMAVGPDGNLYIADSGNHRIVVLDAEGNFLHSWGEQGGEPGQLNEPWGIAVDEEAVYVADTWNHRIQKFTLDGRLLKVIGQPGDQNGSPLEGLGLFFGPRTILLLDDNLMLIADTGNHRLQLMDREGTPLQAIGGRGSFAGLFSEPVGLAQTPDGLITLVDTWNHRLQFFSSDLRPFSEWPVLTWGGESTNNKPYAAIDSLNRIYLTDPEKGRVLVFDAVGEYLGFFDTIGLDGERLVMPTGIFIDAADAIYVVDTGSGRIVRYAPLAEAPTPTPFPTETPTATPTAEATATPTVTATATATATTTPTAEVTATGEAETTPEAATTDSATPEATATPEPEPTATP